MTKHEKLERLEKLLKRQEECLDEMRNKLTRLCELKRHSFFTWGINKEIKEANRQIKATSYFVDNYSIEVRLFKLENKGL